MNSPNCATYELNTTAQNFLQYIHFSFKCMDTHFLIKSCDMANVLVNVFTAAELYPTYTSLSKSQCDINPRDIKCDNANKLDRTIHYLIFPDFGNLCFNTATKQTGLKG